MAVTRRMTRKPRRPVAVVAVLLGLGLGAVPHARKSAANPIEAAEPPPQPTNLQVLPATLSGQEVVVLMRRYTQELGVHCVYCHAEDPVTQKENFPSDENPRKQTARIMIGMVADINNKYLAQIGDRRYAVPITCGNCHRGQTEPPSFEPAAHP
jgi:mono/diheme cytochrome c family protein